MAKSIWNENTLKLVKSLIDQQKLPEADIILRKIAREKLSKQLSDDKPDGQEFLSMKADEILIELGRLALLEDDIPKSNLAFQLANEVNPDSPALRELESSIKGLGRSQELIESKMDIPESTYQQIRSLLAEGRDSDAKWMIEQAIEAIQLSDQSQLSKESEAAEIVETQVRPAIVEALARYRAGDSQKSLAVINKALQEAPNHPELRALKDQIESESSRPEDFESAEHGKDEQIERLKKLVAGNRPEEFLEDLRRFALHGQGVRRQSSIPAAVENNPPPVEKRASVTERTSSESSQTLTSSLQPNAPIDPGSAKAVATAASRERLSEPFHDSASQGLGGEEIPRPREEARSELEAVDQEPSREATQAVDSRSRDRIRRQPRAVTVPPTTQPSPPERAPIRDAEEGSLSHRSKHFRRLAIASGCFISSLLLVVTLLYLLIYWVLDAPPNIERVRFAHTGSFILGCASGDPRCAEDEAPIAVSNVPSFSLSVSEVTFSEYAACVSDEACAATPSITEPDSKQLPVTAITWQEAATFCDWAGGRLPTELEFEVASRLDQGSSQGGAVATGNYGDVECCGMDDRDGWSKAAPVNELPIGPSGLKGIGGNVAEWTATKYDRTRTDSTYQAMASATAERVVVKGGSWLHPPTSARPSARQALSPTTRSKIIGFRCAWSG